MPKLSNNLAVNTSDITVKNTLKIAFQKTRNYYNDNKALSALYKDACLIFHALYTTCDINI